MIIPRHITFPGDNFGATTAEAQRSGLNKGDSMIEIEIPKETTWDLPEGNFAASIQNMKVSAKQSARGMEEQVRILFEVKVPGMGHLNTLAGRNFKMNLNPGSDLRNFLGSLLGSRFFLNSSGQKFDLESLIGRECELKLEHFCGRDYEKPMVVVAAMYPPKSLTLTPAIPKEGKD